MFERSRPLRVALGLVCAATLLTARPAQAHKRDFAFTYDWWTPAKGEKEIESYSTYLPEDDAFEQQVEFETGITDNWSLGLYGVFDKAKGENLEYVGYKVESRYRFGDYEERKVLPAAYLEYAKEKGEDAEVEAKGIFSYFVGDQNISLNLVAERPLKGNEDTVWEYAAGYSRGSANPAMRYGLESTGSFNDSVFRLGPVVSYDVNSSVRVVGSGVFGLNKSSDTRLRLLVEYEWF
jgi:hypothetical protein